MGTYSWDDDSLGRKKDDRAKFKKDMVARVCVLDQEVAMQYIHYREALRYVTCTGYALVDEMDPSTPGKIIKVWRKTNPCYWCETAERPDREPEERFAAHLLIYGTDQDGMPLNPLTFTIKWWAFSKDKFQSLRMYRKNFGDVRTRDILVTCTNEQYQHTTLTPANEAWWLMDERFKQMVAERYRTSKFDLEKMISTLIPYEKQAETLQKRLGPAPAGGNRGQGGQANRGQAQMAGNVLVSGGMMPSFGSTPIAPPHGMMGALPGISMPVLSIPSQNLSMPSLPPPPALPNMSLSAPVPVSLPIPNPSAPSAASLDDMLKNIEGLKP